MASVAVAKKHLLYINHLEEVFTLLNRAIYESHVLRGKALLDRWNILLQLGLTLGLSKTTLEDIKEKYKDNNFLCVREFSRAWLNKEDDVESKGDPSWPTLIAALKSIGEYYTADEIHRAKHPACIIFANYHNEFSTQKLRPTLILLHKEGIIGKVLPTNVDIGILRVSIQDAICVHNENFEKFAAILQLFPATISTGKAMMDDYRRQVKDGGDQYKGSLDFDTVPLSLIPKIEVFRIKFAGMMEEVRKVVVRVISVEDLMEFCQKNYSYLKYQLDVCYRTEDVFRLISERCALINVKLLEGAVNRCNIEEAKAVIQKYKESVKEFYQTTELFDFFDEQFSSPSPLCGETAVFLLDRNSKIGSLSDIDDFMNHAFDQFSLHVRLVCIRESDFLTITCSFPFALTEQLTTTAHDRIESLKGKGLCQLTIGYDTVYNSDKTKEIGIVQTTMVKKSFTPDHSMTSVSEELQTKDKMIRALTLENERLRLLQTKTAIADEDKEELHMETDGQFCINESESKSQSDVYMVADVTSTFHLFGDRVQSFDWDKYGFRLKSPQGVVAKSETCSVAVTPLVGGDFEFPEGTVLVSAVYTLSVSKPLLKPLTIELQHCVDLKTTGQTECLKFVRASLSSKPPHQFTVLEGGVFNVGSRYGSITHDKFCAIGIIAEMSDNEQDDQENEQENDQEEEQEDDSEGNHEDDNEETSGNENFDDSLSNMPLSRKRKAQDDQSNIQKRANIDDDASDDQIKLLLEETGEKDDSNVVTRESSSTTQHERSQHESPQSTEESHFVETNAEESHTIETGTFLEEGACQLQAEKVTLSDMVYTGALYYEPKDDHWLAIFTVVKELNALREYIDKFHVNAEPGVKTYGLQFVLHFYQLNLTKPIPAGWNIIDNHGPIELYQCDINMFKSPACVEPPCKFFSLCPIDDVPNPSKWLNYKIPLSGISLRSKKEVSVTLVKSHKFPKPQVSQTQEPTTSVSHTRGNGKKVVSIFTESKAKLIEAFSKSEPVFRDVISACEEKGLITNSESKHILDAMTKESAQARARELTEMIQTVVEYSPDHLNDFLSILQEKGNIPVRGVANDIATKYNLN